MAYFNLDESYPKIGQPEGLTIELMEHQKTIVNAMIQLEKTGRLEADDLKQ